uniref:Uncharacterized protein n=1 Tax=Arundo donax TaxID=35708 RepID=A0A0A9CQP5_ARUDO
MLNVFGNKRLIGSWVQYKHNEQLKLEYWLKHLHY